MNPFDQNDLIAYHLHELPPQRARALRRALRTDAQLALEFEAIAATLSAFSKDEAVLPLDAGTLDRYWLALLPSLAAHAPKLFVPRSLFHGWRLAAVAGTTLAATTLLISLHHHRHPPAPKVAETETTSETIHTLPPSQLSNTTLFASSAPPSSAPRPLFPNRTQPPLIAPLASETASNVAETAPSFLSPKPPAPTTPAEPHPAAIGTAPTQTPTQTATPLPSDVSPPRPSIHAGKSHTSRAIYHPHTTDLSLAVFANLTATSSSTTTSGSGASLVTESHMQTASPAVGALASFHQQFRPWLGYRVTAAYFHPTFEYSYNTSTSSGVYPSGLGLVNTQVYEFAGTYVVQGPHRRRLTTSVEAGASLLDFVPNPNQSQTTSIRAAAIVGVGTEYSLTKRLSLRAEYRAQIYKTPAFSDTNVTGTFATTNITFSSNPILGITYHIGKTGND